MQSYIAPLAWEYYARNRWKLLLPLIANIPASLVLLPFAGLESAVAVKEFRHHKEALAGFISNRSQRYNSLAFITGPGL